MKWQTISEIGHELDESYHNYLFMVENGEIFLDAVRRNGVFMTLAPDCEMNLSWIIIKPNYFMVIEEITNA